MVWLNALIGILSLLTIGGGVEGFLQKGSKGSLFGGLFLGVLLLVGIYVAAKNQSTGYGISAFATCGLLAFFGYRYATGHAIWPALVMVIASAIVLAAHIYAHFKK